MSQRPEYLFSDLIPNKVFEEYFDSMVGDKAVYVTVVLDEDQRPSIYLEKFEGAHGLCRMFFRKEDARSYVRMVANDKGIPVGVVRSWETSFSELVKFMIGFNSTIKEQGRDGVHVVATMIYRGAFRDVDTVWTTIPSFMV